MVSVICESQLYLVLLPSTSYLDGGGRYSKSFVDKVCTFDVPVAKQGDGVLISTYCASAQHNYIRLGAPRVQSDVQGC